MTEQLLMPVNPTDEMVKNAFDIISGYYEITEEDIKEVYKNMVSTWVRENRNA